MFLTCTFFRLFIFLCWFLACDSISIVIELKWENFACAFDVANALTRSKQLNGVCICWAKKGKSALAGVCIHTYSSLVFVWPYEIECRLKSIRDLLFCKTIRIVTWVFANQNTLHGIPDTVPCWSQPCNIVANSNTNIVKDTQQSNTHAKFNFIQRTSTEKKFI